MTSIVDKFIEGTKSKNYSLTQVDSYIFVSSKESGIVTIALNELSKTDSTKVYSALENLKHRILYIVKSREDVPDTFNGYYDSFITNNYNKKTESSTLRISLDNWINQAKGKPEYIDRINAAKKICEAFVSDHVYLDLSSLNLTSLPDGLSSFKKLKYISTKHINLDSQSETFKSFFSKLKTQGFEEEFARIHPEQYALLISTANKNLPQLEDASRALSQKLGTEDLFPDAITHSNSAQNQSSLQLDNETTQHLPTPTHIRQTNANTTSRTARAASAFFLHMLENPLSFFTQTSQYTRYHIQKTISNVVRFFTGRETNIYNRPLNSPISFASEELTDLCKACSHTSSYSEYEGWRPEKTHKLIASALDTMPNSVLPDSIKDQLKRAFEESSSGNFNQATVDKIKSGQLVVLPLGYSSKDSGHSICVIFYQGKMMICNRGARNSQEEASLVYFQINPYKMNLTLLKNLEKLNKFKAPTTATGIIHQSLAFYKALPIALDATPIEFPHDLLGKSQKFGTCAYTSAKKAVFAALFMMQSDKENVQVLAKTQKRALSVILRSRAINALRAYNRIRKLGDKEKRLLKHAEDKLASYKVRKTSANPIVNW